MPGRPAAPSNQDRSALCRATAPPVLTARSPRAAARVCAAGAAAERVGPDGRPVRRPGALPRGDGLAGAPASTPSERSRQAAPARPSLSAAALAVRAARSAPRRLGRTTQSAAAPPAATRRGARRRPTSGRPTSRSLWTRRGACAAEPRPPCCACAAARAAAARAARRVARATAQPRTRRAATHLPWAQPWRRAPPLSCNRAEDGSR
jgi:hypothetical protein